MVPTSGSTPPCRKDARRVSRAFKAGCTEDTKGGSLGDPVRALHFENLGLIIALLSSVSGGSAIGLRSKSINRIAHGMAFALLVLFVYG